MATSFIHLHCHSNFSMLDGAASVADLVERASALRMQALALTDYNNLSASVDFFEKVRLRGIKPVIGAEVGMEDGGILVLLVKNTEGYRNLCRLLTTVHLRDRHGSFKCTVKDIIGHRKGLILMSGGPRGTISRLLMQRKARAAAEMAVHFKKVFGGDFYLEICALTDNDVLLNCRIADIGKTYKIPLIASNDVFLAVRQDQPVRAVLRAVGGLTTLNLLEDPGNEQQYLKSAAEMEKLFKRFPEAVRNTAKITEKCRFEYSLGQPVFPRIELPEKETPYSALWKTAFDGLKQRYRPLKKAAVKRLEYELNIIHEKGFAEYFLIAKDIVDYCCAKGIPCVGRGSAGDSLVSYVLGITQADPILHDLYFERFLNPERSEPPDIDLDICWKCRDDVLDYIYKRYGHDKTAMICTYNTFQLRSAVGDIGKAFGLSEDEMRKLTKTLPHRAVSYLERALKNIPECRDHPVMHQAYRNIVKISEKIAGFPRHLSVHSGGVIIAPDEITRFTALEESAKGLIISQHDMRAIEKLGLVKMDILGVRGLSVIADTMKAAGISSMDDIPDNDPDVMEMIMSGKTMGCFQLESPAMRGLLRKMQVQTIEDVIAAVAVIRPGPAEGGMKDAFIRRRAGIEKITYPHPLLEPVLKETFGIVVYQEQVLKVASIIAGFSFGEADLLRRSMTKSRTHDTIKPLKEKFVLGALTKGLTEKHALGIWQFLENFVGYGFNKAHSATYGILAYKSAYLKQKYPIEFMTAVMNNGGGFYSLSAYVEEARRIGIAIEPPDVRRAEYLFTCNKNTITSGMYPVHGFSKKGAEKIIEERKNGKFRNIFDFLQRVRLKEAEAAALVRAGALRPLHESEPEALAMIKMFYRNNRKVAVARRLAEGLSLPAYTFPRRIIAELQTLRFAVSAHPLSVFSDVEFDNSVTSSDKIEKQKDASVSIIGWMVTSRRAPTKDGKYIKFATMEDKHGLVEVVLFPEVYEKYGKILRGYGPFKITGTVQSRVKGEANIIAERVRKIRTGALKQSDYTVMEQDIEDTMFFDLPA
ncbi:DNA polymerase III subunit alpha [candidate division KSB1 bacterium]